MGLVVDQCFASHAFSHLILLELSLAPDKNLIHFLFPMMSSHFSVLFRLMVNHLIPPPVNTHRGGKGTNSRDYPGSQDALFEVLRMSAPVSQDLDMGHTTCQFRAHSVSPPPHGDCIDAWHDSNPASERNTLRKFSQICPRLVLMELLPSIRESYWNSSLDHPGPTKTRLQRLLCSK